MYILRALGKDGAGGTAGARCNPFRGNEQFGKRQDDRQGYVEVRDGTSRDSNHLHIRVTHTHTQYYMILTQCIYRLSSSTSFFGRFN